MTATIDNVRTSFAAAAGALRTTAAAGVRRLAQVPQVMSSLPGGPHLAHGELGARRMFCLFVGMFLLAGGLLVKRLVSPTDKVGEVPPLLELLDPPSPDATPETVSPRITAPQPQRQLEVPQHIPAAACALLFAAKPGDVELSAAVAAKAEASQQGVRSMEDRLAQVLAQRLRRSECSPGAVYENTPQCSLAHVSGHEVFCA